MKFAYLILVGLLLSPNASASAQEKVIVGHSARAALSIGPLLYGIERGFYRDEGIELVYVSLRADLGIKALLSGDIDYSYSTGTIIRGALMGLPVRNLTFDFSRVLHALMSRPEIPNAGALKGKRVGVSSFGATGDLAARVGLRSTRALKAERAGFISFAQRKYGYSKDVMEEAYKYLVDALSQDGFVEDASLQAAIDEAKSLAKITKSVAQSDVVDYSFLRTAVKK